MPRLRVCHLSKYYPPAPGGIETHVRTLARAQADLGALVRVFCVNHDSPRTAAESDGPVEVVRFGRRASGAKIDYCPGLAAALSAVEADVLHLQVPNPTMMLALLRARPRVPLVITYQSDVVKQRLRAALFRPLERALYRRAALVLPTSPTYAAGSVFLRPYAAKVRVLPMGIDLAPYLDPSEGNRARAEAIRARYAGPIWLGCGRLIYYKGFPVAVRALSQVRGTLLLVGDGPDRPKLDAEAAALGVRDRVAFLGAMPYQEIVPYYLAADAFWFPSVARSEAFGLVQVEAMACGTPVINAAIPHSGVPWVSQDGVTGLTVPVGDAEALAAAAGRLMDEPGLRERLGAAARGRAVREFDHRVMARRSLALYEGVLSGRPGPPRAPRPRPKTTPRPTRPSSPTAGAHPWPEPPRRGRRRSNPHRGTPRDMRVLVTGSNGLIGSEAVAYFDGLGADVVGVDNNMRAVFFGADGDTRWNQRRLETELRRFAHRELDIRDRDGVLRLVADEVPDLIVHCAAQPSHDLAARMPFEDFDVNAVGTLNLLEATRRHQPEAVFVLMSTNKVYGDSPNELPLKELETRWDYADETDYHGIDESCRIDRTLHSLFGASKTAADVLAQEYGKYFGMKVGVFRGGCLTGPQHSGVELHGFLSYLVKAALTGVTYRIYGYKGKQVRDNIHCRDVCRAIHRFYEAPRPARSTTSAAAGAIAARSSRPRRSSRN